MSDVCGLHVTLVDIGLSVDQYQYTGSVDDQPVDSSVENHIGEANHSLHDHNIEKKKKNLSRSGYQ